MKRVVLLAVVLLAVMYSGLQAFPIHEIEAVLGFYDRKLESQFEYSLQGSDSSSLNVSARFDDDLSGSLKAENMENGIGVYVGKGSPANTIALRCRQQVSEVFGRPLPWTVSSSAGGMLGMGLRYGIFDFLMLMDTNVQLEEASNEILQRLSNAAVQISSIGSKVSGGLAISVANLKRESYGEGWNQELVPFSGGMMSTFSVAGRVLLENFLIETWASLSAGVLESPGFAFSILGGWEFYRNPCIQIHAFSFLSSDRYRNWLGKTSEFDLVGSGSIQADWENIAVRIDGKIVSDNDTDLSWQLTKSSFGMRFVVHGLILQGDVQIDREGLDSASGRLGYRMGLRLLPRGYLDLSLIIRANDSTTYSSGLSIGWKLSSLAHSGGKAGIQFSTESGSEGYVFSVSGNLSQDFPILNWAFASIGIKSPEGGYRLDTRGLTLPEANISVSLVLPPY